MNRRRCVRCGCEKLTHELGPTMFQPANSGWTVCPSYVEPAPWWLRLLTKILRA